MVTSWSVSLEKPGVQPWPLLQACEFLLESSQPSSRIPSWGSPGPLPPTEDGAPQCLGDDVQVIHIHKVQGDKINCRNAVTSQLFCEARSSLTCELSENSGLICAFTPVAGCRLGLTQS